MTLTRIDLLRMQYRDLVAADAELRVPAGWMAAFERWLDDLDQARRAVGSGKPILVLECVPGNGGLDRRVSLPWCPPKGLHERVEAADRRLDETCARTCRECGSPGAPRFVGGVMLVACEAHAQGFPAIKRRGNGK